MIAGMGVAYSPEFSGAPLAIGSIRGMRAFRVNSDALLTGLYYRQVWTPEENRASHLADVPSGAVRYFGHGMAAISLPDDSAAQAPVTKEPDNHKYANCVCGFYAYYTGENNHRLNASITGVIEGYGETVIGTKGFRCQKAKILALCTAMIGSFSAADASEVRTLLRKNYPDIPVFDDAITMKDEFMPLVKYWGK